jgi:hypothetical protein
MDALSQVLRSLRLRGSFYALWDLQAPWGLAFRQVRHAPFHYMASGSMWMVTDAGLRIHLEEGDVLVLFDGAAHLIGDLPDGPAERIEDVMKRGPDGWTHKYGGRGDPARLVCGKFALDDRESGPVSLTQLPALVHLRRASGGFARILELLVEELRTAQPGAERVAALLTETLLIHVLREVVARSGASVGWMFAHRRHAG